MNGLVFSNSNDMRNKAHKKQRTSQRTLADVLDENYISKRELMYRLRESLTEMYIAQRDGVKRKTLQEVIDEL